MVRNSLRLKELYTLLEKIDVAALGNDWQSKKLLKELRVKVVNEIKQINYNLHTTDMVK
jgi:hypothetical protein